jgi:hypothetical protein
MRANGKWRRLIFLITLLLVGCDSLFDDDNLQPAVTPVGVRIETSQTMTPTAHETATDSPPMPTLAPTITPLPFGLEDALAVMSGICFESAFDATGNVFVMRSADDHIHFYDLAEHSELCRRPIIRNPFEFSNGRILAGIWTAGIGCTADHDILDYQRDEANKTLIFQLRFVTAGDCPYELVRPFWVAINNAQDYEVTINVEKAG